MCLILILTMMNFMNREDITLVYDLESLNWNHSIFIRAIFIHLLTSKSRPFKITSKVFWKVNVYKSLHGKVGVGSHTNL